VVYEFYKPLRNHLREVNLLESLAVIRAYAAFLQFKRPFPADIEVDRSLLDAQTVADRSLHEWELDVLLREIILNAQDSTSSRPNRTLRRWHYFAGAVNKLKALENEIGGLYPPGTALREIHRIAHRQFPWQERPNERYAARYYKIFTEPELRAITERVIGLSVEDMYLAGFALLGTFFDLLVVNYPPSISIPGLDLAKLDAFLKHFSLGLRELREKVAGAQQFNENYAYTFNVLRAFPIIRMPVAGRDAIVCPLPTFLFRRFIDGVYYEVCDEAGFDAAFGNAFQAYIGDVIHAADTQAAFSIVAEAPYSVGKHQRHTVDWLVEDNTGVLFIEAKTKRLRFDAKVDLSAGHLEDELEKMADFIIQVYKTIEDYREGRYPVAWDGRKRIYPLIVTLEEWFLLGPAILQRNRFARTDQASDASITCPVDRRNAVFRLRDRRS
jgi:hypothetical protein